MLNKEVHGQLIGMIRIAFQMVIRIFRILERDENTTILVLFGRCKIHLICGNKILNEKFKNSIVFKNHKK